MTSQKLRCWFQPLATRSVAVAGGLILAAAPAQGAIIWNGPPTLYSQPNPDPTQTTNQDHLTANVALTRGSSAGLFNAVTETLYTHNVSPANTEWAFGELANYASLTYTDWEDWFGGKLGGGPSAALGHDAVVHLISDDVYLSIRFTFWGGFGGGFAYVRSTPSGAPPAPPAPVLTGAVLSGSGTFQLAFAGTVGFTNIPGYTFTILDTTNLSLAATNWNVLGQATDAPPGSGSYQFTDPGAGTNQPQRFYRARWP